MLEDREPPAYVTEVQKAFDRTGLFRAWAAVGDADGYRWAFTVSGPCFTGCLTKRSRGKSQEQPAPVRRPEASVNTVS